MRPTYCIMFVISLAPLTALPQPGDQLLHYFSKEECKPGQLAEIALNRRTLLAIVFDCKEASAMRIAIKNSPYPLKNISSIKSRAATLSPIQLQLALWISSYYFASLGVILVAMLRTLGIKSTSKRLPVFSEFLHPEKPAQQTATLCMGNCPDKMYQEILSYPGQALFLVPERKDIVIYEKKLRQLFPSADIQIFHAGIKLTEQRALALHVRSGAPCLVLGTRSALLLPFGNLTKIVVEDPDNTSHTSWDQNPHLNAPRAAVWLYQQGFASLLFHVQVPGIEGMQYARANNWHIEIYKPAELPLGRLIDMRKSLKEGNKSILSTETREILGTYAEKQQPIFLFVQRKGFASGILCRDCGFVVMCPNCNVPMVYHDVAGKKFLLCHRCEKTMQAPTVCPSCNGNRIRFIGAGSQRVEEEVKKLFPGLSVCRLDSDIKHPMEFLATLRDSLLRKDSEYNVIVGTQYAWGIIPPKSFSAGVIITIDGLLSLPDYRSQERVYDIVTKMQNVAIGGYIIQTYAPEAPVFTFAMQNDWDAFAKKESGLRKILKWPPFVQIIRMQYAHAQASAAQSQAQQALRLLQAQIKSPSFLRQGKPSQKEHEENTSSECEILGPSPAYIDKVKNKFVWEIILKWPVNEKGEAQNLELRNRILAVLPRGWNIDVDPVDLV